MHLDQNRMCISLLGKILEEYVLSLKNIDRDIFSKQCPYLNVSNQPMRYVTDNYLLHTLINNIYLYIYFKFSKHHILHV